MFPLRATQCRAAGRRRRSLPSNYNGWEIAISQTWPTLIRGGSLTATQVPMRQKRPEGPQGASSSGPIRSVWLLARKKMGTRARTVSNGCHVRGDSWLGFEGVGKIWTGVRFGFLFHLSGWLEEAEIAWSSLCVDIGPHDTSSECHISKVLNWEIWGGRFRRRNNHLRCDSHSNNDRLEENNSPRRPPPRVHSFILIVFLSFRAQSR